jgi:hypothetical protein
MGLDFRGIRRRLQFQLRLLPLRARLALLNLLRPIVAKLGSDTTQSELFAAEWAIHDQGTGKQWQALHRWALYTSVGQALSQWAKMEDSLIAIASLLLRTSEATKVGVVMYSIVNFSVWLSVIDELFLLEPLYSPLKKSRWNKIMERLKGLKETRDRLAHHTIYSGDQAATLAGDTSLKPGRFDTRQRSQKYRPLDYDQISKFMDSVSNIVVDLTALLNAMTDLLNSETSQQKSSEQGPGQNPP